MTPLRWIALLLCAAFGVTGCAPTAAYVAARKAEETASVTLQASYATWRDYDRAHQEQIIEAVGDLASAKEVLSQYRSGVQQKVDDAFIAARNSVDAFRQLLDAAGATKVKDYTTAIAKLLGALQQLASILNEYGIAVPVPSTAKPSASLARAALVAYVQFATGGNVHGR